MTGGTTCMFTVDVTFASDGSSASGLETISCPKCTSTYAVTGTRQ
jgi:hypothetical protein